MRERVLTAVALAPVVLATLLINSPWPLIVLGGIIVFCCSLEYRPLAAKGTDVRLFALATYGVAVALILTASREPHSQDGAVAAALCVLFALGVGFTYRTVCGLNGSKVHHSLGALWFSMPIALCVLMHGNCSGPGPWNLHPTILLALVPVWAGDTAAIFVGRAFGNHPLAPKISPKKSVEGAFGNLLAATCTGVALTSIVGVSPVLSGLCGLAAGVLGQIGDLFESFVKRQSGVKDSGTLLPGHGGILDRIDSFLFTAPIVALVLSLFR